MSGKTGKVEKAGKADKAGENGREHSRKTQARCLYAGRCGGCSGETDYEAYLQMKQKALIRSFSRFGRVEPILPMEDPHFYRHKVHAVFGRGPKGRLICGTYRAGTHRIIPIESCFIEDELSRRLVLFIRDLAEAFRLEPYDEDTGRGFLRHVQIRKGYATGEVLVTLVAASPVFPSGKAFVRLLTEQFPSVASVVLNINSRRTSLVLGEKEKVLYGSGSIRDRLCGLTYRISSRSFYQVNPAQTEKLYRLAVSLAGLTGRETVLDTYCGIGTIGMTAASAARQVIGVELNGDAVRDARANVKTNGLHNVDIVGGDAGAFMQEQALRGRAPDVVFMDPPRSGSTPVFLEALTAMAPPTVVYISCGPESLVRDLTYLTGHGYAVKRLCPVDMFPFTEHVEMVVLLSRRKA